MFLIKFIQVSTVIALMAISISGFAQTKVVVIPLAGDDIPAPVAEPKIVFVSAEQPNANFGGVDGADTICMREATATDAHPSLAGKIFKAWLYDSITETMQGDTLSGGRTVAFSDRILIFPEGNLNLISPTGQMLDEKLTHYLTSVSGSADLDFSCDLNTPLSDCINDFNTRYRLEFHSGIVVVSPLVSQFRIAITTSNYPTQKRPDIYPSNCADYTESSGRPPYSFPVTEIIGDSNSLFLITGFEARTRDRNCANAVSFICLEQ